MLEMISFYWFSLKYSTFNIQWFRKLDLRNHFFRTQKTYKKPQISAAYADKEYLDILPKYIAGAIIMANMNTLVAGVKTGTGRSDKAK